MLDGLHACMHACAVVQQASRTGSHTAPRSEVWSLAAQKMRGMVPASGYEPVQAHNMEH